MSRVFCRWHGRAGAREQRVCAGMGCCVAVRGGVPIKGLAVASAVETGRLGCRGMYSRRVFAHDGIVGHGQVGLNQLVDRDVGHADRRARSLVVSEPHAASACVRQRISPSRKP